MLAYWMALVNPAYWLQKAESMNHYMANLARVNMELMLPEAKVDYSNYKTHNRPFMNYACPSCGKEASLVKGHQCRECLE